MRAIKTIIKAFLCCACVAGIIHASDATRITLRAFDSNGSELSQAQQGKPFLLEVVVDGAQSNISDPTIENAPMVGTQRVGYKMYMVNGRSKINYTYRTRIDTEGTHSIGPAVIDDGGTQKKSNLIMVKVGPQEIARQQSGVDATQKKQFLTLDVKQNHVVVGQKVEGSITFYSRSSDVLIRQLQEPAIEGFTKIGPESTPEQGDQEVDGHVYRYVKWKWEFFAQKPGRLVIPACSLDIVVQGDESDFSGGFGSLFRFGATQKQVQSNSVTVMVDELPAHQRAVDGVGSFRNFTATMNQSVAREGDGVVLTLAVEGEGDFEHINLELRSLPPVFKSYSSKNSTEAVKNKPGTQKKTFEFIVQGMEPGEFELPAQNFTFYDIGAKKYKTLTTTPLGLKVLRHQGSTKKYQPHEEELPVAVETDVKTEVDVLPLSYSHIVCEPKERTMPWSLFMLLFFAPLILWVSAATRRWWHHVTLCRGPKTQWKKAFKSARRHLDRAKQQHNLGALYPTFVQLFSLRCSVTPAQVSDEMTKSVLVQAGCSPELLEEWEKFFAHISAYVFYSVRGAEEEGQLFDQAEAWILRLEKIL